MSAAKLPRLIAEWDDTAATKCVSYRLIELGDYHIIECRESDNLGGARWTETRKWWNRPTASAEEATLRLLALLADKLQQDRYKAESASVRAISELADLRTRVRYSEGP